MASTTTTTTTAAATATATATVPSVGKALQDLVGWLKPSLEEKEEAIEKHTEVREFLQRLPYGTKTLLIGSYKRHTAIKPFHDVDILFEVAPTKSDQDAKQLLSAVFENLKSEYTKKNITLQGHSVGLRFPGSKISYDIVPAVKTSDDAETFWIIDHKRNCYEETHPIAAQQACTEANERAGNLLLPLIKLIKHWNRRHERASSPTSEKQKPLKSFHLEVMCYSAFSSKPEGGMAASLLLLFQHIQRSIDRADIKCPGLRNGPALNIYLLAGDRAYSMAQVDELLAQTIATLERAQAAVDVVQAHKLWRHVLGPEYYPEFRIERQVRTLEQLLHLTEQDCDRMQGVADIQYLTAAAQRVIARREGWQQYTKAQCEAPPLCRSPPSNWPVSVLCGVGTKKRRHLKLAGVETLQQLALLTREQQYDLRGAWSVALLHRRAQFFLANCQEENGPSSTRSVIVKCRYDLSEWSVDWHVRRLQGVGSHRAALLVAAGIGTIALLARLDLWRLLQILFR